jgi:hypothetical protein
LLNIQLFFYLGAHYTHRTHSIHEANAWHSTIAFASTSAAQRTQQHWWPWQLTSKGWKRAKNEPPTNPTHLCIHINNKKTTPLSCTEPYNHMLYYA